MVKHSIRNLDDVYGPRRAVEAVAATLGFSRTECQELAIVMSELCSNIVKYGVRGSIAIEPVDDAQYGIGIALVAQDIGPAFKDLGMALQDGCDDHGPIDPAKLLKRRGLGIGLGAVVRLMDAIYVQQGETGKEIRAVRYLRRPRSKPSVSSF